MKWTSRQVCDAIKDTAGVVKNIAHNLGASLVDTEGAIAHYPAAQEAMEEERRKLDSLIHERLVEQAQQGNVPAIRELERREKARERSLRRRRR